MRLRTFLTSFIAGRFAARRINWTNPEYKAQLLTLQAQIISSI